MRRHALRPFFVIIMLLFSLVSCSPRLPFPKTWETKLNGKTLDIVFYSANKYRQGASTVYSGKIRALDAGELAFWGNYIYTFFDNANIAPSMTVDWNIQNNTITTGCKIDDSMFQCMDSLGGREFLIQATPKEIVFP